MTTPKLYNQALCVFALASALTLQGCFAPEGPGAPAPCNSEFEKVLQPFSLDSKGKHLLFDAKQLQVLLDPNLAIRDIELHLTLRGNFKGKENQVGIALNGLNGNGDGSHKKFVEIHSYDGSRDTTVLKFNLRRMKIGGLLPIEKFIIGLLIKKGTFKVSLHGKNIELVKGELIIRGHERGVCPSPTPSPSPSPSPSAVAPDTSITSVSPDGAVVNSGGIRFEFASDQAAVSFRCSLDGAADVACSSPWTYSGLSNGQHAFQVFAVNAAGLADQDPAFHTWAVDTLAPEVVITNAASLPPLTNSTSISLEFQAADGEPASFRCSLDGGAAEDCVSPKVYQNLSAGSHSVSISALDAAGNVSEAPATFGWVVDLTAPVASFQSVSPDSAITSSSDISFSFGADESAGFECALDGDAYAACSSPQAFNGLGEGTHSFSIRAIDVAGNVGSAIVHAWRVDQTLPVVSLGQVSPPQGVTGSANLSAEFFSSEESRFECSFNGGAFAACSSPASLSAPGEGLQTIAIVAIDLAGNRSAPVQAQWVTDFSAPALAFGQILPSAASYISSSSLSAEVVSSEAFTLEASLNSAPLGQSASPVVLSGLAEGAYSLVVGGRDSAGNAAQPISHGFTVDLTAPVASITADISGGSTSSTSNQFALSANESARFECDLNDAGFSECASPVQVSGLAEGDHVFRVRAIDLAGNVGASASVSWNVDLTPPSTVISAVDRAANDSISFSFDAAGEQGVSFECSMGGAYGACNSPESFTGLAMGDYTFRVRARDAVGNVDPVGASFAFTVFPPIATQITSASVPPLTNQSAITINFAANQSPATFVCSVDGAAPAPCVSPASYSGFSEGAHTFQVWAIDGFGGTDSVGASYSWTVDSTAPVVSNIGTTRTRTSVTITWTTNEPASSRVHWGPGTATDRTTVEDFSLKTSHSVTITGLMPNTTYSFHVAGSDQAGNAYFSVPRQSFRTNF